MGPEDVTILVVDDEPMLVELFGETLEDEGYNILTASSGKEAFQVVESNDQIDLVVSDVCMPNGDGVELLENIKKRNPDKPIVVFVTGFSTISEDDALKKGVHTVLKKPLKAQNLVDTVEQIVENDLAAA